METFVIHPRPSRGEGFSRKSAQVQLSTLVNSLKGVLSRILRRDYPEEIKKVLWGEHLWSPSYFAASCGGAPLSIVKDYIENQKCPI